MDVQKQTQVGPLPVQENRKRSKRRFIVTTIIIATALIVATGWALSSLGIIPGFLAIVISAFAAVFGVVIPLITFIYTDEKPDTSATSPTHRVEPETQSEYSLQQVSQLNPSNYKLFRYIQHAYISRNADTTVRNILRDITTKNRQNKTLGTCVFGKPAQGKTRLAWEAMQAELDNWIVVRWLYTAQAPFDFAGQQGKQIILWLDDLHEYANPNKSAIINDLPRRFTEAGASLIVIATCRDGEDQLQATKYLGSLLEQLIPVTLEDISANEAFDLVKDLTQEGLEVSIDEFDGTPGSLVFGLQRMTSRYLNLTPSAQSVLKAMKLLHSARIHTYTEKRVTNVSQNVFGLENKEWRKAYENLDRNGFIKVTMLNSERILEPIAEIYLEKVVIDYPTPHTKLKDDWINLKENLQHSKDAEGLNSLGLSAMRESLRTLQKTDQFSKECFDSALAIYLDKHDYLSWAGIQNNLGILFMNQADVTMGDQAIKLLNKSIEAFNAALTVLSKENTPAEWIMVQANLGTSMCEMANLINDEDKLKLVDNSIQLFLDIFNIEPQDLISKAEILNDLSVALCHKAKLVEKDKQHQYFDTALRILHGILTIQEQGHNPFQWARTQTNLGATLAEKANLAINQEEKHNLLDQSAQAHRAALIVDRKESIPLSWATNQFNLGSTLSHDAGLVQGEDRNKLLKEANEAFHAALTVLSKDNAPNLWSSVQYHLGTVLNRQARLANGQERLQQLHEAMQAYRAALEVYHKADFPTAWAQAQNGIGQTLYDNATLLDGQEDYSFLEESIQAFYRALEVYTQEDTQSAWSSTQLNLGNSLHSLAMHVSKKEEIQLLYQAIEAFHNALKGLNKTDNSLEWALAQLNLSTALGNLALVTDRPDRQTLLDEGLNTSQAALSIYSRENQPLNYAKAEQLLGFFIFKKEFPPVSMSQIESIQAAISAFRSALEIFTKENSPTNWAITQLELGDAITSLFDLLQENITYDLVAGAVKAFHSALEVYTPEKNPKEWTRANFCLVVNYHVTTSFIEDKNTQVALLRESKRILDTILTFQISNLPQEEQMSLTQSIQQVNDDLDKIENTKRDLK